MWTLVGAQSGVDGAESGCNPAFCVHDGVGSGSVEQMGCAERVDNCMVVRWTQLPECLHISHTRGVSNPPERRVDWL